MNISYGKTKILFISGLIMLGGFLSASVASAQSFDDSAYYIFFPSYTYDSYDSSYNYDSYDSSYNYNSYDTSYLYDSYTPSYNFDYYAPSYSLDSYDTSFNYNTYAPSFNYDSYDSSFNYDVYDTSFSYDSYVPSYSYDIYDTSYNYDVYDTSFSYSTYVPSYTYDSYDSSFNYDVYDTSFSYDSYVPSYSYDIYDTSYNYDVYDTSFVYDSYDSAYSYDIYDTSFVYDNYDTSFNYDIYDTSFTYDVYDTSFNYDIYDSTYQYGTGGYVAGTYTDKPVDYSKQVYTTYSDSWYRDTYGYGSSYGYGGYGYNYPYYPYSYGYGYGYDGYDYDCYYGSCGDRDTTDRLVVSCTGSPRTIEKGERVTWRAEVRGGDGPYRYDWSGDNGLDGNSRTINERYTSTGRKDAKVTVTDDDGNRKSATCSITVQDEPVTHSEDFDVICQVSDTRIDEGDSVTYSVDLDGGKAPYRYEWTGDVEGDDRTETVRYRRDGSYTARVIVRDADGKQASDSCSVVRVSDEDDDRDRSDTRVLSSYTSNTPQDGQVASVYLNQVPSTGADDVLKTMLYVGMLLVWSIAVAVFFMNRRQKKTHSNRIEEFKRQNLAAKQSI